MFLNPLKAELNPICLLLALFGAHHILHVSWVVIKQVEKDAWLTERPYEWRDTRMHAAEGVLQRKGDLEGTFQSPAFRRLSMTSALGSLTYAIEERNGKQQNKERWRSWAPSTLLYFFVSPTA